jgi:D-amino-acid dehydrogenase
VIVAGGHAMLGISQGTGTGLLVSQLASNKKTEINISAFDLHLF